MACSDFWGYSNNYPRWSGQQGPLLPLVHLIGELGSTHSWILPCKGLQLTTSTGRLRSQKVHKTHRSQRAVTSFGLPAPLAAGGAPREMSAVPNFFKMDRTVDSLTPTRAAIWRTPRLGSSCPSRRTCSRLASLLSPDEFLMVQTARKKHLQVEKLIWDTEGTNRRRLDRPSCCRNRISEEEFFLGCANNYVPVTRE